MTNPTASNPPTRPLLRALARSFRWVRRTAAAIVIAAIAGYLALLALHFQPMTMITGSMQKTIPVGSLVVDQTVRPQSLKLGDVITFRKPLGAAGIDSHRIIQIQRSNGHVAYRTKGDSNPVADPWAISFDPGSPAHRVAFSIPYLGYALLFAHSLPGIILLIGYTCFAILATILKTIAETAKPKQERPAAARG